MKTSVQTTRLVVLTLTAEEAAWLHRLMQNPYPQNPTSQQCDPAKEHPTDAAMRRSFFEATRDNPHGQV